MTTTGYRRTIGALVAVLLTTTACLCWIGWNYNLERLDIRATWRVLMDYDRTRRELSSLGVDGTITYLDLYTHANVATSNRSLNLILERERAQMVRELIGSLRKMTGEDLGDDPEKWIGKYAAPNAAK